MFIIIRDNGIINTYTLVSDDSITYKGIFIYSRGGNHYISLKDNYYFSDNTKIRKLEISRYEIVCEDHFYNIEIYVYENDEGYDRYGIYQNRNFILAFSSKADIVCFDRYLEDRYLICRNGYLQSNHELTVNGQRYTSQKLKQEDVIEFIGIRIIYYDDFLYINSFNCTVNIDRYVIDRRIIRYKAAYQEPYYYLPKKALELKIEEPKRFQYRSDSYNKQFVRSLLPGIVMALSVSSMAMMNFYSSLSSSQSGLTRTAYLIMPLSMILTNIMIPAVFYLYDRRKDKREYLKARDDHLKYLHDYFVKLKHDVDEYRTSVSSSFFNLLEAREKMFYAGRNSDDYLKLSLGKTVSSIPFSYEETADDNINRKLEEIRQYLSYVDDIPLFYDVSSCRILTVVSKRSEISYYFHKTLMEFVYKHHFDDLKIAICTQDELLYQELYNIPHLFIRSRRLTISSLKELQELDDLDLDVPLIIFTSRYCEYQFSNRNIHVIYFSNEIRNTYKNSDAIIEYRSNSSLLYSKETTRFSYCKEEVDFNSSYHYLGRFYHLEKQNSLSFSDIFCNFSIRDSYLKKHGDLKADFAFCENELLSFDLHESRQGPHGLIAGSTGSGKSELINSLLLSMCIRYSPEYLNIILIDYKGGGIRESLSFEGETIPHIVASISNLENNVLDRLIISLKNECQNRQIMFRKLSNHLNTSIADIDDYLDSDHQQYGLGTIAHLLIVIDEFAELKKEHPEQIKELISISRIGRSLGLHLLLATQKPSGIIDEEIWSNSRFKISLKVFEEKDSLDIIRTRDAAYIDNPGEFILRVDDDIIRARSIYSKEDINGNEPYEISLLDGSLRTIRKKRIKYAEQLYATKYYSEKIIEVSKSLNIATAQMNFMPAEPADRKKIPGYLFLGEKDDYINNDRDSLVYPLNDNILICSFRKNEICGILNCLNENKRKHIVISNHSYSGGYLSDCLDYGDDEDLRFLFMLLEKEDPDVCIVFEDLGMFLSYSDEYTDLLCRLIRKSSGSAYSFICLCQTAQLSYRLINTFRNKVMIEVSERSDLSIFYSSYSRYKGRSFYYDEEVISFIPANTESFIEQESVLEKMIRQIPESVKAEKKDGRYLAGYDLNSREKIYIDEDVVVTGYDEDLLKIYERNYGLKTILYSRGTALRPGEDFIWLGPGIFSQRLFAAGWSKDLSNDQGILQYNNQKRIIRRINNA